MKNPSNPVHLTLPKFQHRSSFNNISMNQTLSSRLFPGTPRIASSVAAHYCFPSHLELHPPRLCALFLPYLPIILLNFLLYVLPYPSVYILQRRIINMKPTASQVMNHYSPKNQGAHLERVLAHILKKRANFHYRSNVSTSNLQV
jgi:hypothetical protein